MNPEPLGSVREEICATEELAGVEVRLGLRLDWG